jgi:hypothetical protein
MLRSTFKAAAALLAAFLFASSAAATEVLFDLHDRTKTIFPSNLFTVIDPGQNTLRRVNLKKPDCSVNPVPCFDIDVLNSLDGFNVQPRVSIPFSGPIDPSTVNSDSVYLLSLGSTRGRGSFREKVGINQVVWDPASNTLHLEPDELLEQHTRYAVIVTDRVRDAGGAPIRGAHFTRTRHGFPKAYDDDVSEGIERSARHGRARVVAASVFTTMSVSAELEKIQHAIQSRHPAPASVSYFPIASVAGLTWNVEAVAGGPLTPVALPGFGALFAFGPTVSAIAFGKYVSPNYLRADSTFEPTETRRGAPVQQGTNEVHFNIVLPAGPKPAAGYPVAIYGHGFTDHKLGGFLVVAASMAQRGIATVGINVVGHGFGPAGTVTVHRPSGNVTVPGGGRAVDQNGDGVFGSTEGSAASAPRLLVGTSDALRQTTVDLMQLVRQVQAGMDVDGDGAPDLDSRRIYYFGQSFGAIYGTIFLGVEPGVRVGAPNVGGGAIVDITRMSPVFRGGFFTPAVAARGLLNAGTQANENMPFRNEPVRVNDVPGAMAIQDFIDQSEWGAQRGNPVAYAPHLRKDPLRGNPVKDVIVQFAKGDVTVPNPTNSAIVRAGELEDRTTYYRHDLTVAIDPTVTRNPHTFLTGIASSQAIMRAVAAQAQAQIAHFFATDGSDTVDPDGAGALFETPIVLPLPETLNFIP